MWDKVGMAREAGASRRPSPDPAPARGVLAEREGDRHRADLNKQLEQAGRVADYLELGELMARDALMREESCGGHFREEHQTEEGEAKRDDKNFMFVSAWEYKGENTEPVMHKEDLEYKTSRSRPAATSRGGASWQTRV
jgi:succinate dehydrogenase / fumarate reductase flavoprotein subunit